MTAPSRPSGDREALERDPVFGALLYDGIYKHRYDPGRKGSKPNDPGWNTCVCGWEGYWCDWQPHVAAALLAGPVGAALAQARAKALRDAAQDWDYPPFADGCARTPRTGASVNKWLRDRADREDPTNG